MPDFATSSAKATAVLKATSDAAGASNLNERINQHLTGKYPNSFITRYNIRKLVWFEKFNPMNDAIKKEKQLKAGSRNRKLELINRLNPGWIDLSLDLTD